MNKKANKSEKRTGNPCLCQGAGPILSDLFRRLGPPEEARTHFQTARLEILKGLRAVLDARIENVRKPAGKGQKIDLE